MSRASKSLKPLMHKNTSLNSVHARFGHHPLFRTYGTVYSSSKDATQVKYLIDSGASHDFISRKFVNSLGCITAKDIQKSLRLQLPNGTTTSSMFETASIGVSFAGTEYAETRTLLVVDIIQYDIVLGRPWLHDSNPTLDWKNNDVRFHHNGKSVFFKANAEFETETVLKDVQGTINALEALRLVDEHQGTIFAVNIRLDTTTVTEAGVHISSDDTRIHQLYKEFVDVFPKELPAGLPKSRGQFDHKIDLIDERAPSAGHTVRFSTLEMQELQRLIEEMLNKGYIQPTNSPFGAPCFFVKKSNGSLRLVVDWRNLNANTIKDRTQLPNIHDLLSQLSKARYFSLLDGHSGFWQILLRDGDQPKTAFRTPFGNYEWNVMGFGLTNAPATYQSLMNSMFRPFLSKFVAVYLDDVLVFSNTLEEHLIHLRKVLEVLRGNNIRCNPNKCTLAAKEVLYLGHIVGHGQLRVDPAKVEKVVNMPRPNNKADVLTFLGMCGYLAEHIVHYSDIALPLTDLTHHDALFIWTDDCEIAFTQLKQMITTAPVLRIPDPNKPFIVASDASIHSGSAVLIQCDEKGIRHPVAYWSRKWTSSEFKWATRDKEARAMLDSIEFWSTWLKGRFFTCETDHRSLQHLRTQRDLLPRQERLLDILANYNFDIKYVPGPKNGGPDGISRLAELATTPTLSIAMSSESNALECEVDQEILTSCKKGYAEVPFFKR